jgi:hypothetical protein
VGEPVFVHCILEFWFGGPPAQVPFAYQRSSVIDFNANGPVIAGKDLARNLTHVPVLNVHATLDPLSHLVNQTKKLHAHLLAIGGQSELLSVPGNQHLWSTLDETLGLDWLETHRLELPTAASTLADRDGRWFAFEIEQDAAGAFTPFTWASDPATNALFLADTQNLRRIGVRTRELGLDSQRWLRVETGTADALADEIRVFGYAGPPGEVRRDGLVTAAWSFEPGTGSLLLLETDGTNPHLWEVLP